MKEYVKIETPFVRAEDGSKKLMKGIWQNETIAYLKDIQWEFTEKIDGTNIRVHWDGHRVSFGGRTDKAVIPDHLLNRLTELFGSDEAEELFEQKFGETEVTLYGEGYGVKIQNGGSYRPDVDFILFDVLIGDIWLKREAVKGIAVMFGIEVVPYIGIGTLQEAVEYVKSHDKSMIGTAKMEGIVARPIFELRDRLGKRIIVKIKRKDFV